MPTTGLIVLSEESPVEPNTPCDACGARGTVGRAIRTGEGGIRLEVHRFCLACWPEQSARFAARWREEDRLTGEAWVRSAGTTPNPSRGVILQAATWHSTLEIVRQVMSEVHRQEAGEPPPRIEDVARRLAREIIEDAPTVAGEMPIEVEVFLDRFGDPAG